MCRSTMSGHMNLDAIRHEPRCFYEFTSEAGTSGARLRHKRNQRARIESDSCGYSTSAISALALRVCGGEVQGPRRGRGVDECTTRARLVMMRPRV